MIITIAREFGSGGRELGRRLAEELHIAYYDKEILTELKKRTTFSMEYIENVSEDRPYILPPINYGNSFMLYDSTDFSPEGDVHKTQDDILKDLASKSDCVIIGRASDYVLSELHPFRIFVYADMPSKVKRCRERQKDNENLTDKQMEKEIRKVDKKRRSFYEFYTCQTWDDKSHYDMMINTSNVNIKEAAHTLALLIKEIHEKK